MATTVTDHLLPIGGERIETGSWLEVHSPYSGEVVGRVASGGAAEVRRALDAAKGFDALGYQRIGVLAAVVGAQGPPADVSRCRECGCSGYDGNGLQMHYSHCARAS